MLARVWRKGNTHRLLVKIPAGPGTMKISMEQWKFLKKLNMQLPYNPAMPCLGIYPKDSESAYHRHSCTSTFITALFEKANISLGACQVMNG